MKNRIRTRLIFAALCLATAATQAQSIQGDFENWDSTGTDFFRNYLPTGWMEVNNYNCEQENKPWAVTRTSDARSGDYAILLRNTELSINTPALIMTATPEDESNNNRVPVNTRHTRLNGYYKYQSPEADTFFVSVIMMKGENFIGYGEYTQYRQQSAYTYFDVPIIYVNAETPDAAIINILAGSSEHFVAGSTLTLDDLSFNLSQGLADTRELQAEVSLWPNPATDQLHVSLQGNVRGQLKVEVVNLLGATIHEETIATQGFQTEATIQLSDMPSGILFVKVSDETGSKGFRILHQ